MNLNDMSISKLKTILNNPKKFKYFRKTTPAQIEELIKKKEQENLEWLNKIDLNTPKNQYMKLALEYLKRTRQIKKEYSFNRNGYVEIDFTDLCLALYKIAQYFDKAKRGKYARRYRKV